MKYFSLTLFLLLRIGNSYCQDSYLQKFKITNKTVKTFLDSINTDNIIQGREINKIVLLGKGEYYYANNDSFFIYDNPNHYEAKKIKKQKFSDSIYVFKTADNKPIIISVTGDGFDGDNYYLCGTNNGKLALFLYPDFISKKEFSLSPNKEYYITTNIFSCLIFTKDCSRFIKLPTQKLIWLPDNQNFIYNNCSVDCDTNSQILSFNLKTWSNEFLCKGVSPTFFSNYNEIIYFGDTILNGVHKEYVISKNLKGKEKELFYQIPDSLTYWSEGDDYRTPSEIKAIEINGKNSFEIRLHKKDVDMSCDYAYLFYFNENGTLIEIRKI